MPTLIYKQGYVFGSVVGREYREKLGKCDIINIRLYIAAEVKILAESISHTAVQAL